MGAASTTGVTDNHGFVIYSGIAAVYRGYERLAIPAVDWSVIGTLAACMCGTHADMCNYLRPQLR